MKTEDLDGHTPSKWIPITDLPTLAALGKLQEELGELTSIVARCIIQGIDECDPETGRCNRLALQDELADVNGLCVLVSSNLKLDGDLMKARAAKKYAIKQQWLKMLKEE